MIAETCPSSLPPTLTSLGATDPAYFVPIYGYVIPNHVFDVGAVPLGSIVGGVRVLVVVDAPDKVGDYLYHFL